MNKKLILCECGDISHQMIATFESDDILQNEVWISYHINSKTFIDRLKNGIKHIFGFKSKYGDFGEFIITHKNIDKFEEIVKFIKNEQ